MDIELSVKCMTNGNNARNATRMGISSDFFHGNVMPSILAAPNSWQGRFVSWILGESFTVRVWSLGVYWGIEATTGISCFRIAIKY